LHPRDAKTYLDAAICPFRPHLGGLFTLVAPVSTFLTGGGFAAAAERSIHWLSSPTDEATKQLSQNTGIPVPMIYWGAILGGTMIGGTAGAIAIGSSLGNIAVVNADCKDG
ncbi:MAG: hypothetical protein AB2A00_20125, partial [Myxococcota bacterium]